MDTENSNYQAEACANPAAAQQAANQMEPTTQRAMTRILGASADLNQERMHNGLGARGRALSTAITKLDEARFWLAEAERL